MKDKNKKEKTEYISLLEAAKISGYAQDYLSLLCRQGKMKGEKIGRNWTTTYQWLDEYQRNLISDMTLKKNSVAPQKDFKEIEDIERIKFFESIKITYSRLLQRCGRAELFLATSLFFLILLSGFAYAKNPQFFSNIQDIKKKATIRIVAFKSFKSDIAEQIYQTKDQIAYRMSEVKTPSVVDFKHSVSEVASKISDNTSRNIYSRINAGKSIAMIPLQVGEKFGESVITYPIKIGDGIEKGFQKSDLVLNSSLRKFGNHSSNIVRQTFHNINNIIASEFNIVTLRLSKGIDNLQFPKFNFGNFGLAIQDGTNSVKNIRSSLLQLGEDINNSFSWVSHYSAGISEGISDGVNNFSKGVLVFFKTNESDDAEEFQTPSAGDFRRSTPEISDGRVAGASTKAPELNSWISKSPTLGNLKNSISQSVSEIGKVVRETPIRISDAYIFAAQKIVQSFGGLKNNIYLAIKDAANALKKGFEKGIILCQTTLTIRRDGVSQAPSVEDFERSAPAVAENQKQEAIQKSSEELSENINNVKIKDGLVVLPSPKSEKEKEKLKEKIELSFSDEVKIKQEDATSGIITPIFRKSKGDDYLYLLIPMEEE